MKLRGAARTDPGRVRRENQDSFGLATNIGLGFVADGMGGHAGGRRASEEAARVIMESVAAGAASGTDATLRLKVAIDEANRRIWTLPQTEPALHGLGTTIAALLVDGDVVHIAHVGDSRVYRIRNGTIEALTRDHSYLNELAARGIDLADAAMRARYESVLTRALGVAPTVEPDLATAPLQSGDTFVICSDGVYRVVSTTELTRILAEAGDDLETACTTVIARANEGGGPDNCTIVALRVDGDGNETGPCADGACDTTLPSDGSKP